MSRSQQGVKIAFIGINRSVQVRCTQYLKLRRNFTRLDMDRPIKNLIRASYPNQKWVNIPWSQRLALYDSIYAADPNLIIGNTKVRLSTTESDVVIPDVRYLNEMQELQKLGFIICRVTTGAKPLHLKKYLGKSESGTVAMSLVYDSRFAAKYSVEYSLNPTNFHSTKALVDQFLEKIGYQLDL